MMLKRAIEDFALHTRLAYQLVREATRDGKLVDLFHQEMFRQRVATPAELDLSILTPPENIIPLGFAFFELMPDEILGGKWSFAVSSRGIKARHYIKKGPRLFAIVEGDVVAGDLWCMTQCEAGVPVSHPDLDMLGIHCKEREAYLFDVFIAPSYRGRNLSRALLGSLHAKLKSEGYRKLYSYYYDDNVLSRRMHHLLKFDEMVKLRISRFFFYKSIKKMA